LRVRGKLCYWWLTVIIATGLLTLWSAHSSRPKLEWWTGPAEQLSARGETDSHWFQVRVLIPSGWTLGSDSDANDGHYVWQPPKSTYPRFLQWFAPTPESEASLSLLLRLPGYHGTGPIDGGHPEGKEISRGPGQSFIWRQSRPHTLFGALWYSRSNRAAFTDTHHDICASLQIKTWDK
jgi:hypothetical protein